MSLKAWWLRTINRKNKIEQKIDEPEKEPKWCEHPKQSEEVIDNGGIYCGVCGQTNLYQDHAVTDGKGNIVYHGNARDCARYVNKKNGYAVD